MTANARCGLCSNPATMHITDASLRPPISSHYCEEHNPSEADQIGRALIRRIWNDPVERESAIDFFAAELGVNREEARTTLETNLCRVDQLGE